MKLQKLKEIFALCAALFVFSFSPPALAQSDWTVFFTYNGINFYYSPGSVQHSGDNVTVKWHDSSVPLVYLAQISCTARTIQSLSVNRYDQQSGDFIETVDLSNQSSADAIGPPGTMASNLAQLTC